MVMENSANSKVVQRYVDILTNPGFKAVFGDVANKDAVMMIINEFLLAETIFIIFAELAGFDKTLEECVTAQDRMLYVLKNLGRLKNRPQWLQNEIYECIFRACEISAFTEEKRIEYEKEMNDEKRLNGIMRAKLEEGIEQGIEKGIEQGVSQTIRQFHAKGMPASQIADFLDMSLDQVESILAEK